ncbi:MAG: DpnI domain-containing protein [Nanoarchaeota archaeon]|nr:DpnI domain-containing protein [Nanoarchaeota archaeon]
MNLSIYQKNVFNNYKSNSQIARILSESWFSSEMYCPCCLNKKINTFPHNKKARDFFCDNCKNEFQLKSSSKKFGRKVVDGEFNTMIHFIDSNIAPNFFLMHYSPDEWIVKNLFMIPKFFISSSIIEKRNPLSLTARRAGWTGCNILIERIPDDGRIQIIKNEKAINQNIINKKWQKMTFLNKKKPDLRGWTSDVLRCIEDLKEEEFTLKKMYHFVDYLKELHPHNQNIEAKIRQQLQVLRDHGILRFISKGKYLLIK